MALVKFLLCDIQYSQCLRSICAVHHHALAILPNIQFFNDQQVVMFLIETILLLHVEGFQPTFFVERKYIEYSFLIRNILLLVKASMGLFLLLYIPYPLCL